MTSKELARLANVSQSTVSRVLNGYSGVSEEKRCKVLELAKQYDFELDSNARSLRMKTQNRVGVVLDRDFVGFDINMFWSSIYSRMYRVFREKGYMTFPIYGINGSEKTVIHQMINQRQTDKFIIVSINDKYPREAIELLVKKEIPFVYICNGRQGYNPYPEWDINVISIDFYQAGRSSGEFLHEKGHRNVALVNDESNLSSVERCQGIMDVLNEKKEASKIRMLYGKSDDPSISVQGGYNLVFEHLDVFHEVSAVFAINDASAIGIISALQKNHISVPEQISVMGVNNIPMCTWWEPHLTTVDFDLDQIAEQSCEILLNGDQHVKITIPQQIVVRDSVK